VKDSLSNGGGGGVSNTELERRERQWMADKATLEEFYEVSAKNQCDAELQVRTNTVFKLDCQALLKAKYCHR